MTETAICVDCGGPRSTTSGERCRACYTLRATAKKLGRDALALSRQFNVAAYLDRSIGDLQPGELETMIPLLDRLGLLLIRA